MLALNTVFMSRTNQGMYGISHAWRKSDDSGFPRRRIVPSDCHRQCDICGGKTPSQSTFGSPDQCTDCLLLRSSLYTTRSQATHPRSGWQHPALLRGSRCTSGAEWREQEKSFPPPLDGAVH